MDGKMQHRKLDELDPTDPFSAGQMVGMLVILSFIEQNNGIPKDFLQQLKTVCAEKSAIFLDKPTEDVLLYVDSLLKEINDENNPTIT